MLYSGHTILLIVLTLSLISFIFSGCNKTSVSTQESETKEIPEEKASSNKQEIIELSTEAAKLTGIKNIIVKDKAEYSEIKTTGEIKSDESKVFHINSIVAGRIAQDKVSLGQFVKEGDLLAVVQNIEVAKTYSEYVHQSHQNEVLLKETAERLNLYKKNLDRNTKLYTDGILPQKDVLEAQNQVSLTEIEIKGLQDHAIHIKAEAEALLSAYGVKLGQIDPHIVETGSLLRAPRSGVVIQKNITVGDVVSIDQALYVLADLSQVWLDINIYDKDLASVALGEKLTFTSDSLAQKICTGQINYILPSVSDSRTFIARAVLSNPKFTLKPGMFGQVKIQLKKNSNSLPFIPDRAIQKFQNETFVFIDLGSNRYEKRLITLGERSDDGYFVESGLKAGEIIVTEGSFDLKSELLKSQFGESE